MLESNPSPTGSRRYADPETLDHLIKLQKEVAEANRQIKNILDHTVSSMKEKRSLILALQKISLGDKDPVKTAQNALKETGHLY